MAWIVSSPSTIMSNPKSGEIVSAINPNDVLLGRRGGLVKRPGNLLLRKLVRNKLAEYHSPDCKNQDKDALARQIVQEIEEKQGRFLRNRSDGNDQSSVNAVGGEEDIWEIADMETVLTKVKQTFRDENPVRRRRQADRSALKLAARSQQPYSLQPNAESEQLPGMAIGIGARSPTQYASEPHQLHPGVLDHGQQQASPPLQYAAILEQQLQEQRQRNEQDLAALRAASLPGPILLPSQLQEHQQGGVDVPGGYATLPFQSQSRNRLDTRAREDLMARSGSIQNFPSRSSRQMSAYSPIENLLVRDAALDRMQSARSQSVNPARRPSRSGVGSLLDPQDPLVRLRRLRSRGDIALSNSDGALDHIHADDPVIQARLWQLRGSREYAAPTDSISAMDRILGDNEAAQARLRQQIREATGSDAQARNINNNSAVRSLLADEYDASALARLQQLRQRGASIRSMDGMLRPENDPVRQARLPQQLRRSPGFAAPAGSGSISAMDSILRENAASQQATLEHLRQQQRSQRSAFISTATANSSTNSPTAFARDEYERMRQL